MNSFDAKFFNKSLWKPKTNIKAVKPITPHFAKPATKGASLTMQKQWKAFSFPTKQAMRMKYPDRDGDRVPDRWDCQPLNFRRQENKPDIELPENVFIPYEDDIYGCPWCGKDFIAPKIPTKKDVPVLCPECNK
jgi:hypothetical protein